MTLLKSKYYLYRKRSLILQKLLVCSALLLLPFTQGYGQVIDTLYEAVLGDFKHYEAPARKASLLAGGSARNISF